jgi:hypothetical protein
VDINCAAPSTLLQAWRLRLSEWSIDGSLSAAGQTALGLSGEPEALQELISEWAAGDFKALPPIEVLDGAVMPGAAGAYAISTGTIYLNGDWLQLASEEEGIAVLSEELGHHLDGLLNTEATPGDEGEQFSLLLRQMDISPEQLTALGAEDDHTSLLIDGAWIAVEQSAISTPQLPDASSLT